VKLNVNGSCDSHEGLALVVLFGMRKVTGLLVSPPNGGQCDVLFTELFTIYHGIALLPQHGHLGAIIESDIFKAIRSLTQRNKLEFHECNSLLLRITSLIDHVSGLVLHHIFREANHSADWLTKYENSFSFVLF